MVRRLGLTLIVALSLGGCAEFSGSSDFASAPPEPAFESAQVEADGQVGALPAPIVQPLAQPMPQPVAVAQAAPPQGKYGVQIAAPRSVADARALIDNMRAKYPAELGNRWAAIHRVALPGGVFYRVVIGPMQTAEQASQLCGSLKARGTNCFIRQV
ncbi:MAG: SPOR domain-containing protein [Pseudolabrys sp.]